MMRPRLPRTKFGKPQVTAVPFGSRRQVFFSAARLEFFLGRSRARWSRCTHEWTQCACVATRTYAASPPRPRHPSPRPLPSAHPPCSTRVCPQVHSPCGHLPLGAAAAALPRKRPREAAGGARAHAEEARGRRVGARARASERVYGAYGERERSGVRPVSRTHVDRGVCVRVVITVIAKTRFLVN